MDDQPILFVDLDGVLVDFDRGVLAITGKYPDDQSPSAMWPSLARSPDFYNCLSWRPDGHQLWSFCQAFSPRILTGLPNGNWAEPQKRAWCLRELGPDVVVLTCLSRDKAKTARQYCGPDRPMVLVDDREKLRDAWEALGGTFVLHRRSTESISRLQELGFGSAK